VIIGSGHDLPADDAKPKKTALPNQAKVVVQLPEEATLYVDGQRASLTSATRSFLTPELELNKDYYYTIQVEANRNGETVTRSQRVIVRAGQVSKVDFGDLTGNTVATSQEPAPAPAHVTVLVPEDARVYVDDVLCPQTSSKRSFDTPQLEPGRAYVYTVRAEVVRNGKTKSEIRKVEMQAGRQVQVDFAEMNGVQAASR
jgi:uncharacterized protein (TIGR03000 family)